VINANGQGVACGNSQSAGSGGAIRLVANTLTVGGTLQALAGFSTPNGIIRLEAPQGALSFTGFSNPPAVLSQINPNIAPAATPRLTLVSIGGASVPSGSGSRPDTVDVLLPTQMPDPVALVVNASNIPVGSQVTVSINPVGSASATAATLTGTDLSSTATINISGLSRTLTPTFIFASATFQVPVLAQGLNPQGADHVARLRIDAAPGKESQIAFLRLDGSEVSLDRVPPALRQMYGR
jgi:hypothetical protein